MRCLFAALMFACAGVALAQEEGPPVPVDQASYHVPIFRNQYITALRVNIPGGRSSDYHIHSHDQVCVVVDNYPPEAYSEPLGGPPAAPRGAVLGETTYINYAAKPVTHRAVNPGTLPRHSICAELLGSKPYGFTPAARNASYTPIFNTPRARAWRLVLEPGQIAPAVNQEAPGLRVVVRGGEIADVSPGKRDRSIMLLQGNLFWQNAGASRAVRNTGATRIEIVEFEFK
jgi:hypothetical protein